MADKNEIWKSIPNYEGLYEISNFGRVKSLKKNLIMNCSIRNTRYNSTYLYKLGNSKQFLIHRLVAISFIDNPNNLPEVNHINGNKNDNNVNNLEWVTRSTNIKHSYDKLGKIAPFSKIVINLDNGIFYNSAKEAAKSINISYSCLRAMLNNQNPNRTNLKYI